MCKFCHSDMQNIYWYWAVSGKMLGSILNRCYHLFLEGRGMCSNYIVSKHWGIAVTKSKVSYAYIVAGTNSKYTQWMINDLACTMMISTM